jgi:hypothetical protein
VISSPISMMSWLLKSIITSVGSSITTIYSVGSSITSLVSIESVPIISTIFLPCICCISSTPAIWVHHGIVRIPLYFLLINRPIWINHIIHLPWRCFFSYTKIWCLNTFHVILKILVESSNWLFLETRFSGWTSFVRASFTLAYVRLIKICSAILFSFELLNSVQMFVSLTLQLIVH